MCGCTCSAWAKGASALVQSRALDYSKSVNLFSLSRSSKEDRNVRTTYLYYACPAVILQSKNQGERASWAWEPLRHWH